MPPKKGTTASTTTTKPKKGTRAWRDELFEVETIVGHKKNPLTGKIGMMVKWKGFPDTQNSIEPESSLKMTAPKAVKAYWASLGKQVSSDEEEDTTDNDDHNSAIAASDSDAEQQVGPSTSRRAKRTKNGPKPNKTTGRPRGRPPGKNGPKPNKTTGRPRGRPPAKNGSKPNKTTGRPRGRPPGKAPKPKNTITTTTGRRRGRPRKLALNNIEPVPAVDVGNVPMKQIIHPAAFPLGSNYLQANGHAFGDGASIYIGHTIPTILNGVVVPGAWPICVFYTGSLLFFRWRTRLGGGGRGLRAPLFLCSLAPLCSLPGQPISVRPSVGSAGYLLINNPGAVGVQTATKGQTLPGQGSDARGRGLSIRTRLPVSARG